MSVRLDNLEVLDRRPLKRALISVYDKTGLIDLAAGLHAAGVEIVSTGSTASTIAAAGIPVTPVEEVTDFPEVLEGRVKTLHPRIHAGILADQRKADHRQQLADLNIAAFDLVICNLYPFSQTVANGGSFDECVEQIDIGGPSMLRAAAKNHPSVAVVTDPENYPMLLEAAAGDGLSLDERRELAMDVFFHTAEYDRAVSQWFAEQILTEETPQTETNEGEDTEFPLAISPIYVRSETLRYGENPHQAAAVYVSLDDLDDEQCCGPDCVCTSQGGEDDPAVENAAADEEPEGPGIAHAVLLSGKPMSYNNYTDADAALRAAYDHDQPCVAIIKHANPCGIAVADTVADAHRKAHACDPVSAFGGVIAVNRPVSVELAEQIVPIFTEVVVAPGYEEGAVEILSTKKNLRVLKAIAPARDGVEVKYISGGVLIQEFDALDAPGDTADGWTLVAGAPADTETLADLEFAWRSVRSVRSNAILIAKDGASVGVGMGQVNRVDSCKLAVERANTLGGRSTGDAASETIDSAGGARGNSQSAEHSEQRAQDAVAASDAFFPFADGLQVLIDAGVKAVVQPGGSVRDQESIEAAQAAGITMYLTGNRHFAH